MNKSTKILITAVLILVIAAVIMVILFNKSDTDEAESDAPEVGIVLDGGADFGEKDGDFYIPSNDMSLGEQIVEYAAQFVGVTPYVEIYDRMGDDGVKDDLYEGTDAGGFVSLIYEEFGIHLPKGSLAYQDSVGSDISKDELAPGDIVVYRYGACVGIYAGEEKVIMCKSPYEGTCILRFDYQTPTRYVRVISGTK